MYKVSVVSFRDLFLKEEYSPKGEEKIIPYVDYGFPIYSK